MLLPRFLLSAMFSSLYLVQLLFIFFNATVFSKQYFIFVCGFVVFVIFVLLLFLNISFPYSLFLSLVCRQYFFFWNHLRFSYILPASSICTVLKIVPRIVHNILFIFSGSKIMYCQGQIDSPVEVIARFLIFLEAALFQFGDYTRVR